MIEQIPFRLPVEKRMRLTPRQKDVLCAAARGLLNKEIAYELNLSLSTVKRHMCGIFLRLDVKTRTAAVVKAKLLNLI